MPISALNRQMRGGAVTMATVHNSRPMIRDAAYAVGGPRQIAVVLSAPPPARDTLGVLSW